jgi:tetraacyldisaccharide 4'-kinase
VLNYLLTPLSFCYVLVVEFRHACYRVGIFKSSTLTVPVIVVGSINVGGSGKSPLVMSLVSHLQAAGYKPGVISRGYGGNSDFWPREVNESTTAELVGDEPQLIFEQCNVPVVVGPDRVSDGRYLIDKMDCNILVSDDGYQHFALNRDIDIAVVDGQYGFGNGWCLPAGPLREPKSAINRADIVVVNGRSTETMDMELQQAYNLANRSQRALAGFRGGPVHAVAGIGNPSRFFDQLEEAGLEIIPHAFPDHFRYTAEDIDFGDDRNVLMTEKDGIKCRRMVSAENIWIVPGILRVEEEFFQRISDLLAA